MSCGGRHRAASYRLRKSADFRATTRRKPCAADRWLRVFAVPNGLCHPRLGITVSKRVSAKSVVRNRIKRHIRELFRQQRDLLGGLDIVVVALAPSAGVMPTALRASLARHFAILAHL